ncbi:MAG: exodeoxyribonuclease VII large subunit [Leptospirales bacterium]|nr:exodeoxyribonuclease VII large subunit [Leptospirales bacterium]
MDTNGTERKAYTVSALTKAVRAALEGPQFTSIWLKGEISNLTYHSSGHIYFTLKDKDALIQVTFFRSANRNLKFKLEDGMSVFAFGGVTLFEKQGRYQFNAFSIDLEGVGELQRRIEELKKKLSQEGLFSQERKKPLPFLPRRIGIVTSPTGAAIRDIIKVALRRYPNIEIILAPAKVQGWDAPAAIAKGIAELNKEKYGVELIIATRGGGSFEDLMPFNEEITVRAFASSRLPIISAVGHQTDHPLSDDAADAYAPTPSAAAELAVPNKEDLFGEAAYYLQRIHSALRNKMNTMRLRIENISERRVLAEPENIINRRELIVEDFENRIIAFMKNITAEKRKALMSIPDIKLLAEKNINDKQHRFHIAAQSLDNLSPLNVMKRGYAIVLNSAKKIIRQTADASTGEKISVRITDGNLSCLIESINERDSK